MLVGKKLIGPALALTLGIGVTATPALAASARNASAPAVALASHYQGVPYVWGGTTTRGFDCSGYVQFVFKKLGVTLPRTAEEQWQHVRHITRAQLKPGDLVFWGRPYGVYHVGIYAGHDKIWNAPHTGARVHLETIWGGSKLYGRVRGLTSTTAQASAAASPSPAMAPVGAIGSGAPLTFTPATSASASPSATPATATPSPATPAPTTPAPTTTATSASAPAPSATS